MRSNDVGRAIGVFIEGLPGIARYTGPAPFKTHNGGTVRLTGSPFDQSALDLELVVGAVEPAHHILEQFDGHRAQFGGPPWGTLIDETTLENLRR